MFIDERGCYSNSDGNNFSMVGVIFERDYCTNLSAVDSELADKLKGFKKQIINKDGAITKIFKEFKVLNCINFYKAG